MEDKTAAEVCRTKIGGIIRRAKIPQSNVDKEEKRALQSLRKNERIVIIPADKGNATVFMDVED